MDKPVQRKPGPGLQWSINSILLAAALFLTAFANLAFFRNLAVTFAGTPWGTFHLASLALFLLCVLVLFLSLLSLRPILKPALLFMFLLASVTAYFMDTYYVMIDRDMIANVMATDAAESLDLLTPKLLMYVGFLGLLPSLLVLNIRVTPASARRALRSRLLLTGAALLTMLVLVLS